MGDRWSRQSPLELTVSPEPSPVLTVTESHALAASEENPASYHNTYPALHIGRPFSAGLCIMSFKKMKKSERIMWKEENLELAYMFIREGGRVGEGEDSRHWVDEP